MNKQSDVEFEAVIERDVEVMGEEVWVDVRADCQIRNTREARRSPQCHLT